MGDNGKLTWSNERRRLGDLKPWPRNPRQIKTDQAKRLAESLEQFDQVETIAVGPDNSIYNGHQRLNVWREKYGPDLEVDVRVASRPLTEKEREKLTIFLHKGASGEWNFDLLANEFEFNDLLAWGFDEKELLGLDFGMAEPAEDPGAEIDRAEELREKWQTASGQLWELGEHRLIVGDCTDAEVVARVMQGERAAITFTSPPYNAGKTPTEEKLGTERKYKYYSDDLQLDEYLELLRNFTTNALEWSEYVFVNIQMLAGNKAAFLDYLGAFSSRLADIAIWDKQRAQPAMAENVLNSRFEFLLVFGSLGASRHLPGNFRGTIDNVYSGKPQTNNDLGVDIHAATMPLDFAEWVVGNFSTGIVYEPFCGSGTTIVACERLSRRCRACEISPAYCAVALERWSQMTGKEPRLME